MINNTNKHDTDLPDEAKQFFRLLPYVLMDATDDATRFQKWHGLMSNGMSEEKADELCKPKEMTKEERYELLAEHSERERRELDRYNREHNPHLRKNKPAPKTDQQSDQEIDWSEPPDSTISLLRQQKELRDKVAALKAKTSIMVD